MRDDRLLVDPETAAKMIGMTTRFLEARRSRGGGPPFVRISSRKVMYRPTDLERWAESLVRTSTSDPGDEAA